MPAPMEICLEDLDVPPEDERYIRCVALPGGNPGLALDREGLVRWMPEEPADYGLWVSADDRLVLLRGEGAGPILVERGGRTTEAPPSKPVVLLAGDLLRLNGRRLRVHVHGVADEVFEPERFSLGRLARSTAAALALGAMVGAGADAVAGQPGAAIGAPPPIEVRRRPPKPAPPRRRVVCSIQSMRTRAKKTLLVEAKCPEKITVGTTGYLLDAKGAQIKSGSLVVKKSKGKVVEAEAYTLKKKVKAKSVLFRVYRF